MAEGWFSVKKGTGSLLYLEFSTFSNSTSFRKAERNFFQIFLKKKSSH